MAISGKIATFALVIELERHIEILLLSNDCVIVPDFGGFMAHHVDARYDGKDNLFLPPLRTIGFNPQLTMNDSLLAQSYVEAYDISYPEAINRIADEVAEIRQHLENTGKYELNDIGILYLNEDGNYTFEPCEAGILTPELYGLGSFDMHTISEMGTSEEDHTTEVAAEDNLVHVSEASDKEPMAEKRKIDTTVYDEEDDNKKSAEFIQIRKSFLRNLAAACIALIAFFALSTPLGNPNLQKSQIDTGLLTRIMPKELTHGKEAHDLVLTKETEGNQPESNVADNNEATQDKQEVSQSTPYYSIVLASRVTKRNAASYVNQLQAKGFKDARVLITNSNVKVIYGTFRSEGQAYNELNRLQDEEAFIDGWVTKVQE